MADEFHLTIQDVALRCRNFKCFSEKPQGLDRIRPLNIIIGRNNSGKSTLLDLIEFATTPASLENRGHKQQSPQVYFASKITDKQRKLLPDRTEHASFQNSTYNFNPTHWANGGIKDAIFNWELNASGDHSFAEAIGYVPDNDVHLQILKQFVQQHLRPRSTNPFRPHIFRRILAERNIVPESANDAIDIQPDGRGVTNALQRFLTSVQLDIDLVEKVLLNDLNAIFKPDADYTRLLVRQHGLSDWELFLEEPRKGRVPMSQTGSGLKTVLLVLANLLIVPKLAKPYKSLSQYLFAFEELENNLHPAVQRRLFLYLRKKAIEENCHFFITTHSNVVIDLFSGDERAQILHVTHDGESAAVNVVETSAHGHRVLDDLDVRASDLLQTNAVVWVEGPSDRFYFSKWIELWSDGKLVEGVHYQCLPYGGSCNAHFSFDSPEMVEELIPALKINRNAILLADSDKEADEDELKVTPRRLAEEVKKVGGHAWITQGKEVENYIPTATFQRLYDNPRLTGTSQYKDVFEYVAKQDGKAKPTKTALAHRVLPMLTKGALAETLDMAEQLNKVCALISRWNRLSDG